MSKLSEVGKLDFESERSGSGVLIPAFFRVVLWSLADELLGAFRSVISTTTSSSVVRKPLVQSGQNDTSTFDLITHNRKLRMDVGVWDTYRGRGPDRGNTYRPTSPSTLFWGAV